MKKIALIRTISGTEIEYNINKIAEVQNYIIANPKGFLKIGDNLIKISTISEIIATEREFTASEKQVKKAVLLPMPGKKRASVEFAEKIGKLIRERIYLEKQVKNKNLAGNSFAEKRKELEEIKQEMAKLLKSEQQSKK